MCHKLERRFRHNINIGLDRIFKILNWVEAKLYMEYLYLCEERGWIRRFTSFLELLIVEEIMIVSVYFITHMDYKNKVVGLHESLN